MVTVWAMEKWWKGAAINVYGVMLKIETRFVMLVENDR